MSRLVRFPMDGLEPGQRELTQEQARYLCRVYRLRGGDRALAFDPEAGLQAIVELLETRGNSASVVVGEVIATDFCALPIHLLQCIGKSGKPEQVARDATAQGVARVTFVQAERTQARLAVPRVERKRERLRSVCLEAARQSGRGNLPRLDGPLGLGDALKGCEPLAARWVLAPGGEALGSVLTAPAPRSCCLLVGPEGGLSDGELALAEAHGFVRVSLGHTVLRTELAAVVSVATAASWLAQRSSVSEMR